jgi:hypothetical protein
MPAKQPSYGIPASGGLSFVNDSPNSNYRALRLDSTDNHLYWESTYQNILRNNKDFSDFFPNAEFADNGNQVTFTKYINGEEVLAKSRPMRPGESISRSEWERFLNSWHGFKALAEQPDVPEDIEKFIKTFGPPRFDIFPSAYRIYKPHWYSKPRLIMLWGLEPPSPSEIPNVYDADEVISQIEPHVEPQASQNSFNFARFIKFLAFGLVALFLLIILLWLLIPMPMADFQVSPRVNKPTKISNTTQFSKPNSNYGVTSYAWIIEKGSPNESSEFEPVVTWKSIGQSKVTLEVTRLILWGLLSKKDEKTKAINVMPEPVVAPPKKVEPPIPINPLPDTPPAQPLMPVPVVPIPDLKPETIPSLPKTPGPNSDPKPNKPDEGPKQLQPPKGDARKATPLKPGASGDNNPGKNGDRTPQIKIISQSIVSDGSQKIEFSVDADSNIELSAVSIDGLDVDFKNNPKTFKSILRKGMYRLELSYRDLDGNSDTIIQEINVDSRPDNKLTPPIKKFKQSDLEMPEQSSPKPPEDNFNKKLA